MSGPASPPRVSLVVEWENALLADAERPEAMLRELRRQVAERAAREAGFRLELVVAFDPERVDRDGLAELLAGCLGPADAGLERRLVPAGGGGYYRSKNLGVAAASGEVVAFLDSDVVPEPGWLDRLLDALASPGVEVVAGSTYVEPVGLVGKTFALTWFFPLRGDDGGLRRASSLFANNLAMRRELAARHPFPDLPGTSRGACLLLAAELERGAVALFHEPRARAAHPAPDGFRHVSLRALAQGRDRILRERHLGRRLAASAPASLVRLLRHWGGSSWRVATGFGRVGLHPLLVPAAIGVAAWYYLLFWAGETMLLLGVPAVRRIRI